MCLIIVKPEGIKIPNKYLETAMEVNDDGWGVMAWRKQQLLTVKKGLSKEDFWKVYNNFQERKLAIHFRLASAGSVSLQNCHPFEVSDDIWFFHNGTISRETGDKSDTAVFVEEILQPLKREVKNFWKNPLIEKIILKISPSGRFVLANKTGDIWIINKNLGVEENNIWMSNASYMKRESPRVYDRFNWGIPGRTGDRTYKRFFRMDDEIIFSSWEDE